MCAFAAVQPIDDNCEQPTGSDDGDHWPVAPIDRDEQDGADDRDPEADAATAMDARGVLHPAAATSAAAVS